MNHEVKPESHVGKSLLHTEKPTQLPAEKRGWGPALDEANFEISLLRSRVEELETFVIAEGECHISHKEPARLEGIIKRAYDTLFEEPIQPGKVAKILFAGLPKCAPDKQEQSDD